MDINKNSSGSVVVESAIIFPFVMLIVLFGYSCMVLCMNYFKVGACFNQTAEQLSDYAYIYHEKIISSFSKSAKTEIKTQINSKLDELLANVPKDIAGMFDVKGKIEKYEDDFLDKIEDQVYMPITYGLFTLNLPDYNEYISNIDFSRSSFFHNSDNDIILELRCDVKMPLMFFNSTGVGMTFKLKTKAWLNGVGKEAEEKSSENIWDLSNFDRGRKIRSMYGANLPDNFPVISAYKDNRVIMIKSLDYRKESYLKEGAVYKAADNMMKDLYRYNGQDKPYGKDDIVIKSSEIKQRELILVIPNDTQSELFKGELNKVEIQARKYGIILTVRKL